MSYTGTLAQRAALYLLMYNGKRGTQSQIATLLKQLGDFAVIRMATERGFKQEEL